MDERSPANPVKGRIVTVRLSDKEYRAVRAALTARGYRSISDLARAALQRMTLNPADALPDGGGLDKGTTGVHELLQEVERLHEMIARAFGIAG